MLKIIIKLDCNASFSGEKIFFNNYNKEENNDDRGDLCSKSAPLVGNKSYICLSNSLKPLHVAVISGSGSVHNKVDLLISAPELMTRHTIS